VRWSLDLRQSGRSSSRSRLIDVLRPPGRRHLRPSMSTATDRGHTCGPLKVSARDLVN